MSPLAVPPALIADNSSGDSRIFQVETETTDDMAAFFARGLYFFWLFRTGG